MTKLYMNISLPDKPSELIRVALEDLRKTEKDPRYRINFKYWHSPEIPYGEETEFCEVCLAGAVIAQRGNVSPDIRTVSSDFASPTWGKLQALDDFRLGDVAIGVENLDIPERNGLPPDREICTYDESPQRFYRDMHKLADDLEAVGL